jgi:uncharacterized protein YaaW (UPF0174 family)
LFDFKSGDNFSPNLTNGIENMNNFNFILISLKFIVLLRLLSVVPSITNEIDDNCYTQRHLVLFQMSEVQYRINQMLQMARKERRKPRWYFIIKRERYKIQVIANVLLILVLLSGDVELNPGPINSGKRSKDQCPFCNGYFSRLIAHINASHKYSAESNCDNPSRKVQESQKLNALCEKNKQSSVLGRIHNSKTNISNLGSENVPGHILHPGPSVYNPARIIFPEGRDPRYLRPIYTYEDDSSDEEMLSSPIFNKDKCPGNGAEFSGFNEVIDLHSDVEIDTQEDNKNQIPGNAKQITKVQCPICGGNFKENGLNIHIAKAHPEEGRKRLVANYDINKLSSSTLKMNGSNSKDNSPSNETKLKKCSKKSVMNGSKTAFDVELEGWLQKFQNNQMCDEIWDRTIEEFQTYLAQAIHKLPGPKHPAQLYYEARKKGLIKPQNRKYNESSNPTRKSKREKERRKARYEYQITQYLYYNQRRKAVRKVLNENKQIQCKVDIKDVYNYFNNKLSVRNSCIRSEYENIISSEEKLETDNNYNKIFTGEDITNAMRKIRVDTAAGPDRVILRVIKNYIVADILAIIANRMLQTGQVPNSLRKARTVLVYKNGDPNNLDNWRPISITSVIRRTIERVIEKEMRQFLVLNENQRGFTNSPGCQINIKIIDETLEKAKKEKKDITLVFLDIKKAFDSVGHDHLRQTIMNSPLPSKLQRLIMNLLSHNETQVHVGLYKTKTIKIEKGVFQGSPISPLLYNLSTDFILQELTEPDIANEFGFRLGEDLNCVSVLGFADDTVLIANSKTSAEILTSMAINRFKEIGLEINFKKSHAICLEKGLISKIKLVSGDEEIQSISKEEKIKYLGVILCDDIIFNSNDIMIKLTENLNQLSKSILLSADQKLNIVNQYISPTLIYPLQTAKLKEIPKKFLNEGDKIIRSCVREILQLPGDTPNSFLYSDKKYKGLGIIRLEWEAYIQQFNKCILLENSKVKLIPLSYEEEKNIILKTLNVNYSEFEGIHIHKIRGHHLRKILKNKEFEIWESHPQKGKGVTLFKEVPIANSWVYRKNGLSASEWRDCLKMTCNVVSVRTVPGRGPNTNRCRHCNEFETLAHVLGSCRHNDLLINKRHNDVRKIIADELRKLELEVYEEVNCTSESGSTRRIDIIAIDRKNNKGWIVDPTVRFETTIGQPKEVDEEKKAIYEPTVPFFEKKYTIENLTVIGLLFGSRGTLNKDYTYFRKKFKIPKLIDQVLVTSILKNSVSILRNHLYNKNSL